MSDWFNQYYGCDGPCAEFQRLVNTVNPYSALTEEFISCLPEPTPIPCSDIAHCTSGKVGTDIFVTGTTLSGDKSYTTRNDSEQVLILSGGSNITLTNPSPNLVKIEGKDTIKMLIVSNSMSISRPVSGTDYIGNKTNGFAGQTWGISTASFGISFFNCGIPLSHSIDASVSDAINVCGNLFVSGHLTTVTVEIKIHSFECVESGTTTLSLLSTKSLSVLKADVGQPGRNVCWNIDVDAIGALTECTSHLVISMGVSSKDVSYLN